MSSDGTISGTPTAEGTFTVTVTVTDTDDSTDTKDLSLRVVPAVQITTTSLPDGAVGVEYSQQVDSTGGLYPYVWYCTDLPPGLSISSDNPSSTISGTPTEPGTYDCHVNVTDGGSFGSNSTSDSKTLSITIAPALLIITTTSLSDGNVGNAYSDQVVATGGTPPLTWSATNLPPGLDISSSDGSIYGTPTTEGDYSPTFDCADSASPPQTDSKTLPIKVKSLTLAGPTKIGLVKTGGVAKEQTYTVTVSDASDASSVTLTKTQKSTGDVTIGPPTVSGTKVTFKVKGTVASDSGQQNDVTLKATSTANPAGDSMDISVVIPKSFAAPRPTFNAAVIPKVRYATEYTAPPFHATPAQKAAGWWCVFLGSWSTNLTIKVNDQYGQPLGDLYDGAAVEESIDAGGFFPINQTISGGAYTDPIAVNLSAANPYNPMIPYPTKAYILANTPPNANLNPAQTANASSPIQDANASVKVGGFELDGMVGRQAQLLKGNILKITWP